MPKPARKPIAGNEATVLGKAVLRRSRLKSRLGSDIVVLESGAHSG